jgi:hypothetical protein
MYYTTDVNSDVKLSLAEAFPNWAFPKGVPSEGFLTENNLTKVEESTQVGANQITIEATPYLDDDGTWKNYNIVALQEIPSIDTFTQSLSVMETPSIIEGIYTKWKIVELSDEEIWVKVREKRNWLLVLSDNTQADDVTNITTTAERLEWATYRQELRDIPQSFLDPRSVTYPTEPF